VSRPPSLAVLGLALLLAAVGCGKAPDAPPRPQFVPEVPPTVGDPPAGAGLPDSKDERTLTALAARYTGCRAQPSYHDRGVVGLRLFFDSAADGPTDAQLAEIVAGLKGVTTPVTLELSFSRRLTPAGLTVLKDAACVKQLWLDTPGVKAALPAIGQMTWLEELHLSDDALTDADVAPLGKLTRLRELYLHGEQLTPAACRHLGDLTGLEKLWGSVNGGPFTDADLAAMKRLVKLKSLTVFRNSGSEVTDAGVAHLAGMAGLEDLTLDYAAVTGASFDVIAGLPKLRTLGLHQTGTKGPVRVTPADFARLQPLKDRLKELRLTASALPRDEVLDGVGRLASLEKLDVSGHPDVPPITDAGVAKLADLRELRDLNLAENKVSDAGVAAVAKLPKLRSLGLYGNPVTDAGVAHLKGHPALERLSLQHTLVTDGSVASIRAIPRLTDLTVTQTKLTPAAIDELRASRQWVTFYPR